jgi:acyl-CoA thioesterase FadM
MLLVHTWLERVGNTSFTLKQTILNGREELVVSAEVILTTINRGTRQKVSVPNEVRRLSQFDAILNFEQLKRFS